MTGPRAITGPRDAGGAGGGRLQLAAICAPGLESFTAAELRALGVNASPSEPGVVPFTGGLDLLYRANLHLRTASRVIARLGEFHARALGELERRARLLPWGERLDPARPIRLRVTCRKSRLYHSGAVAERVASAIEARTTTTLAGVTMATHDEEEAEEAQLIIVRLLHDQCTISLDSSGALLHRRGYRLATAKAPLRETLAAALLLASGWGREAPLLDPFCGSGTIAIEAALLAREIAPGLHRRFAFMHWPGFDEACWARALEEAHERIRPTAPAPIQASDRDPGAVDAARMNAERAGVAQDIELARLPLSAIAPPSRPGWVVTNPPYGVRVGEQERLHALYGHLGTVLRRRCPGWMLTLLSADRRLDAAVGIELHPVLRTRNGGIAVRALAGRVPYP